MICPRTALLVVWKGRIAVLGVLSPTVHAAGQQVALGYLHSGTTCSAPQQAEPMPDLVQAAPSQLLFSSTSFGETPGALLDMQGTPWLWVWLRARGKSAVRVGSGHLSQQTALPRAGHEGRQPAPKRGSTAWLTSALLQNDWELR